MFKSYSSNPVIQLARFGPANGRTPFFAKGLDSQAAAATTPKERLMELGKDAVQYEKDVTIGKCKATFAQVIKLLINEKIMIRYRYRVVINGRKICPNI